MPKPRRIADLTPREQDVLALLRERLTNEAIADRLGISFETAKHHVAQVLSKLGVESREEAAAWEWEPARHWTFGRAALALGGTGVVAAAIAGLALLSYGVSESGGDAPVVEVTRTPSPGTSTPGAPTPADGQCAGLPPVQVIDAQTGELSVVAHGLSPAWSPEGGRLAILSGPGDPACTLVDGVYVVDVDSGDARRVYEGDPFGFEWSPDGERLAVTERIGVGATDSPPDILGRLILVDAEDGAQRRMSADSTYESGFSGDGSRLAFSYRDDDGTWGVRVVPTGGDEPILGGAVLPEGVEAGWVTLSPDGSHLAFTAHATDAKGNPVTSYLYAGPVDGEVTVARETSFIFSKPEWSPDGSMVAASAGTSTRWELYTFSADGRDETFIGEGFSPSWSPDGAALAFVDEPCGVSEATVLGLAPPFTRVVLLPGLDGLTTSIAWSPGADRIAVAIEAGSDRGLYVVNPDGSDSVKLVETVPASLSWSPDGGRFAGTEPGGRGFCY